VEAEPAQDEVLEEIGIVAEGRRLGEVVQRARDGKDTHYPAFYRHKTTNGADMGQLAQVIRLVLFPERLSAENDAVLHWEQRLPVEC
jgi:hypothetical protein